jgi:hypothetical protein
MASPQELAAAWLSSSKGEQASSDSSSNDAQTSSDVTYVSEDDVYMASDSTEQDILPKEENASEDAPEEDSSSKEQDENDSEDSPSEAKSNSPADKKTSGSKEVITVTDESGKKKKVEIDYSDRAAIRKAHEMMYGARKWQAERDKALASSKEVQSKLGELESNWEVLNKTFQEGGVEGLIDLLQGKPGAYKEVIKKELARAKFFETASPEEIESLQAKEASERQARELEKIRKENEDFRKQMQQEKEQAELASLESRIHPAFDKYRFADKLGSAEDEHMFDEMLWNTAMKRLESYEEQGLDLVPELVEKEFRTVATSLRNRIGMQAEKKAAKVVEQKKREATENVQAKVRSGYKTGGASKEARDLIESGNIKGLLSQWGKYGGLFNGKK